MARVDISKAHSLMHARMLMARLRWPIPMGRWITAQNIVELFNDEVTCGIIKKAFLEDLSRRSLESQVTNLLFLIYTFQIAHHFKSSELVSRVKNPSVLSQYLLDKLYPSEHLSTAWYQNHGEAFPDFFETPDYFERKTGAVLPLIFQSRFAEVEKQTSLPFQRQWQFEWSQEMQGDEHVYSGTPRYFFRGSERSYTGQFDVRQHDVFLSTFLRTINFAVDNWGMPESSALSLGFLAIPMNPGLAEIVPMKEPLFSQQLLPCSFHENGFRELLQACNSELGNANTILSLDTTLKGDLLDKSDYRITLFYTKGDVNVASKSLLKKAFDDSVAFWALEHSFNYKGLLDDESIEQFKVSEDGVVLIPTVLNTFKGYMGRWHQSYFSRGIRLPAGFNFDQRLSVEPTDSGLNVLNESSKLVGIWKVWHADWESIFPRGGDHNCGMVTLSPDKEIFSRLIADGYNLTYVVRMRHWKRDSDYSDFKYSEHFITFPHSE